MSRPHPSSSRFVDLTVDRLTLGLEEAQCAELERLERESPADELALAEELEYAAARIQLAFLPAAPDSPPAGLLDRLRTEARRREITAPRPPARRPVLAHPIAGWIAAAACLAGLLLTLGVRDEPAAAELRQELLAAATDALQLEWASTGDELAPAVAGDVVWSAARQEGYMRFRALPENDASERQYQLWIFDASREDWEAHPVDGGVFDSAASGEVVVPIRAPLRVEDARLFAVTVEPPGGVVVSRREHLIATASPEQL